MKSYFAFTKKEFLEALRTYKVLIMGCVFLILGMMNPITAKITPQLLKSMMPKGIQITISEPTALDSWAQFYKNIPQMGLVVLVIIFSGIIANEYARGTLINVLTKGLSRSVVILSKLTAAICLWTVSYLLCFGVSYAYTVYFWNNSIPNILFSAFCLWLFGVLLLSCVILGSVLFRNSYGCLLFSGGFIAMLFMINTLPKTQDYNPIYLVSKNMDLLTQKIEVSDFVCPILISAAAILFCITLAVALFNKKQV